MITIKCILINKVQNKKEERITVVGNKPQILILIPTFKVSVANVLLKAIERRA